MAVTSAVNPSSSLQGVATPGVTVNPQAFYAATRRMRFTMKSKTAIAGLGSTDTFQLRQTGIVSHLEVRVSGTVTFGGTLGTSTMSYDWPFNLVNNFQFSANGQANLISARGLPIRALEFVQNAKLDDNGLSASFGGTAATTGTLKLPTDDWGTSGANVLNPGTNVPLVGTYTVDLTYVIPVAADPVSLVGAIYAQSSSTNLNLAINYATQSQILSALGGSATFASALNAEVIGVVYSIPNVGGQYVVPDLSVFHQISESRVGGQTQGVNEYLLPGTGVGRQLLRILFQEYSSNAPLAVNDTNYSTVGWAYGGNDVPESYQRGGNLRAHNVRDSGVDIGGNWGIGLWDFASQFVLRDVVNEGTTSDLRVQMGLVNSPTSGFAQVAQETLFAAPVGA